MGEKPEILTWGSKAVQDRDYIKKFTADLFLGVFLVLLKDT